MKKERIYKAIQEFCLMDDTFMTVVLDGCTEAAELILNIIIPERGGIKVIEVTAQREYKNLVERSVRLDILAVDKEGRHFNVEVQRDNGGADKHRARYNSSMLDTKMLAKSGKFSDLKDSYVIFITETDVLKENRPIYHIKRIIEESGKDFGDGTHIIYVNAAYKDDSTSLGKLMHDFKCQNADNMNYPELSGRVRYFKEEGGHSYMCKIMEDLRNEAREEGIEEGKIEGRKEGIEEGKIEGMQESRRSNAINMLKDKILTYEQIARYSGLTVEEVAELDKEQTA